MGSWTRDLPYLPHVDSVASSFRILVTFAIVLEVRGTSFFLEVRGTSFFQLPWTILGRSSSEPKDDNKSAVDEFSMLYCDSASSTLLHGLSGRIMLNLVRHTSLCIHNSESYIQLPWTILGRSSSEPKDDNKSALDEFSMLYCDSASSTFLHGLSGRIMLNLVRHTNLCIHNSESYMFLWVVPL